MLKEMPPDPAIMYALSYALLNAHVCLRYGHEARDQDLSESKLEKLSGVGAIYPHSSKMPEEV